ncbi:TIGR03668 family PPOX class F420-dependent oxidoreductase [Nocardioides sp. BP30]|uniref:TIGR03668 family PPOX class F420-dependent oxidoreductase n=1 Tax=Nocardioides sp. BP30 TaxID=3036374 RepID=UPI002469B4F0|nr:TIGR03668 family PPOX class F420-dependent oxidoreductase [Nocardioides sp. BP30]WGL53516.1 TIGR03668 family PPOX class F420-dependent oxidoreductase [Nocardioides sp. BP30]
MPRRSQDWVLSRFAAAKVARLATVSSTGEPHLVPIVFAAVGSTILTAVDHKPKSTTRLRRLANIEASPAVSLLVDEYAEDWSQLWWARADGLATVVAVAPEHLLEALVTRYDQYAGNAPAGPFVVVEVARWSGWSAI